MLAPTWFLCLQMRKVSSACGHAVPTPTPERQMSDVVVPDLVCTWSFWTRSSPNAPSLFSFLYFMFIQNSSLFMRFTSDGFFQIFFFSNGAKFSTRTNCRISNLSGTYGLRRIVTYAPCLGKGAAWPASTGAGGIQSSIVYISSSTSNGISAPVSMFWTTPP